MTTKTVIDTNVLIGALIGKQYSANRSLIELCFRNEFKPLINHTLYAEYEDIINRQEITSKSQYSDREIHNLFDAFLSICEWIKIYSLYKSDRVDKTDNYRYVIELAVAGNAEIIVTHNIKEFNMGKQKLPQIEIKQPQEIIESWLQ